MSERMKVKPNTRISLLFSKNTKGTASFNIPHPTNELLATVHIPSQHIHFMKCFNQIISENKPYNLRLCTHTFHKFFSWNLLNRFTAEEFGTFNKISIFPNSIPCRYRTRDTASAPQLLPLQDFRVVLQWNYNLSYCLLFPLHCPKPKASLEFPITQTHPPSS